MLYIEELDEATKRGCQDPRCAHKDHKELDLAQRCHTGAGAVASYELGSGQLKISCFKCRKIICIVAVAPEALKLLNEPAGDDPTGADWIDRTMDVVASSFDFFSKRLRDRVAKKHAAVQIAQNAIMAGYLRRLVEYLQGTVKGAPPELHERFKFIEDATYEKVVVISNLPVPMRMTFQKE
jgi:hypothetical protein